MGDLMESHGPGSREYLDGCECDKCDPSPTKWITIRKPVPPTYYVVRKELKTGIVMLIGHNGLDQFAFVHRDSEKRMAFDYNCAKNMMDLLVDNHKTYTIWSMNRNIPNYEFCLEPKCD